MNKNSIFAFIIILGSVMFFTSPTWNKFYYENILKKEYVPPVKKTISKKKELKKQENIEVIKEQKIESNTVHDTSMATDSQIVNDTFWLENEKVKIGIQSIGASIVSLKMKKYKSEKEGKYIDLIKDIGKSGADIKIGNNDYSESKYEKIKRGKNKNEEYIEFSVNEDMPHKKRYSLKKNSYEIGVAIIKENLPGQKVEIKWQPGIKESEAGVQKNRRLKKVLHIRNSNTQNMVLKNKVTEGPFSGTYKWVGISTKYFLLTVNNDENYESDIKIDAESLTKTEINYSIEISRLAENKEEYFTIYAGPKKREELKSYQKNYESVLFPVTSRFWSIILAHKWFPWLADKVLLLLMQIQKVVKDYGIAIMIVTLISKVITYPMTQSSMKSMERMKDIQPKVNKIREKHKNNAQKMNQEIMELYKKEGVNPLNPGCLPMFLQAPVFISLYVVLQYAIEIRGTRTFLIPWITDLSKPEVLFSISKILPNGLPMYGSNVALLPIIMAVLTFFQQKITIKDPNQKMMIYFMPIFMLVLFNNFPSGLVLYWTFSNAIQLVQQLLLKRK